MSPPQGERITLPWEIPVPSTSFVSGPELRSGQTSVLSWTYEGDSEFVRPPMEGMIHQELVFEGVIAYKCTYNLFCEADLIKRAYNKLVDLGDTEWLAEVRAGSQGLREEHAPLRHLVIFFDEGPCYEFICETAQVSTEAVLP